MELTEDINSSQIKIPVDDTTGATKPTWIQIDSEKMAVSSIRSNYFYATRNVGGTAPASHAAGATVTIINTETPGAESELIGCLMHYAVAQSLPLGIVTPLTFPASSELFDTSGFHNDTNPTRVTIPPGLGGVYDVYYKLGITENIAGFRMANLLLNGVYNVDSDIIRLHEGQGAGQYVPWVVSGVYPMELDENDYIELCGLHDGTGGALNSKEPRRFGVRKIG